PRACPPDQGCDTRGERGVAVGMTDQPWSSLDRDAAEPQRHARPERMAVVAETVGVARRRERGRAERDSRVTEIRREGHLDVAWIAGDSMDSDATGFEQGGFVGEGVRSIRRETGASTPEEC